MGTLKSVLEDFLRQMGRLDPVRLGKAHQKREIAQKDIELLQFSLSQRFRGNNKILIFYVVLIVLLFVISSVILFWDLKPSLYSFIVVSIQLLSLTALVEKLRRIWKEKNNIDIILHMIKELPPDESLKWVQLMYWNILRDLK
jgi:hypothetical protein